MALTTYDELKASIADFLNRDDLTAVIPDFITMAEARLNREVRHWRQEDRATATLNAQYTALPTNFLEPIRMSILTADTSTLEIVGVQEMSELRAKSLNTSGKPQYFTILDQSIEVFPTPDGTYSLEMVYYETLPGLATNSTNWLLTNYPDAYLYGSLLHSAPYLQEDVRIQTWTALYQSAVSAINLDAERAKTGGSGRRMKIRSY
jgi:hypothetical protein